MTQRRPSHRGTGVLNWVNWMIAGIILISGAFVAIAVTGGIPTLGSEPARRPEWLEVGIGIAFALSLFCAVIGLMARPSKPKRSTPGRPPSRPRR